MSEKFTIEKRCYVCGLNLYEYPYDPETLLANPEMICPCCGTHYGLDDEGAGKLEISDEIISEHQEFGDDAHKKIIHLLREDWINGGKKWWSENPAHPQPNNWNPDEQLKNVPTSFK